MAKKRISTWAKEIGVPSKEFLKVALKLGLKKKSALSTLTQEEAEKVLDLLTKKPAPKVRPAPKPSPKPAPKPKLPGRPPIVTVMGHVDHGKTTLLDTIRKTRVADKEPGQITQHIGASTVEVAGKGKIVFIDTPGHEAFTLMRSRGAQVTDIIVLVIAADDGIMPQTREAIDHAKAAKVPIIVAINKIDKENANIEQVKQQLANVNLVPEDWGGETICIPISALKGEGIDHLLEMILLQAEMLELQADPHAPAKGVVIEARLNRQIGATASVVIKEGTLRIGETFFIGKSSGRVRALIDDNGRRLKEAPPSSAVEITGLSNVPQAGQVLEVIKDKKVWQGLQEERKEVKILAPVPRLTLEDLYKQMSEGKVKELNLIIKADVQGALEAISNCLEKLPAAIPTEKAEEQKIKLNIIHKATGEINEQDIMLASTSDAVVIGFNTGITSNAKKVSRYEEVQVKIYRVIYELIEDVKKALQGLLTPKKEMVLIGKLEVLELFKIGRAMVVGCRVTEGKVVRGLTAKLIRDGKIIYEGKISSLRRFKEDVKEVEKGYECGLTLENFSEVKEADLLEIYELK